MMKKGVGLLQPLLQHQRQFERQQHQPPPPQQQQPQQQHDKPQQRSAAVHRLRCSQGSRTRISLTLTAHMTYIVAVQVTFMRRCCRVTCGGVCVAC